MCSAQLQKIMESFVTPTSVPRLSSALTRSFSIPSLTLALGSALLGGCAAIGPLPSNITQLNLPEAVRVPKGEHAVLAAQGKGALLYECQAIKRTPFQYSWVLQNPALKLEDSNGQTVTYYPGPRPRWLHSDGSSITAQEVVEASGNGQNLPLLRATAQAANRPGVLKDISYVQVSRTAGGVVTAPVCEAASLGMRVVAPYESDVVFWRRDA